MGTSFLQKYKKLVNGDEKMNNENCIDTEYNVAFITQRADPYVYKHKDGYYYFTASVPEYDRIIIRKSRTLKGLQFSEEYIVWKKHENGLMSRNIWAPELHYINNRWYIYFAAGEEDNMWEIRPYILECDSEDPIHGRWVEKGKMKAADGDEFSFNSFSLDATVFQHRGNHYCVWAEKVGIEKMISNLYIAQMETPYQLKTAQMLLSSPDYEWERKGLWVNEGPAMMKKNNRIFLTYSASSTDSSYCIGMLFANQDADLLDPHSWNKLNSPILTTDEEKGIFGPGHNSFTVSEEGMDIMVYHARQYKEIIGDSLFDPNRHTMLMQLEWDNEGMPVFEYANNKGC